MQKKTFIAISLGCAMSATLTLAHQGATGIVKTRMDNFSQSQRDLKSSFTAVKAGDWEGVIAKARAMAKWGQKIPSMFPEGSNNPPSEASPKIWEDMSGFTAASLDFVAAAENVIATAETANKKDTIAALKALGQTCSACHKNYRVK